MTPTEEGWAIAHRIQTLRQQRAEDLDKIYKLQERLEGLASKIAPDEFRIIERRALG